MKSVFDDPSAAMLEQLRQEYLEIYQKQLNTHSQLFNGIADLLHHLDQKQHTLGHCHQQTIMVSQTHSRAYG